MIQLRYKYYKIKQDVINLIKTGKLLSGEIVHSEAKLIKKYDVSRITARKALDVLANEGYINKIQGKGCYVKNVLKTLSLSMVCGYTEEILRLGIKPSRKVLKSKIVTCFKKISNELEIPINSKVYELKRIYYADGNPLCLTTANLPYKYFNGIEKYDFFNNSLYSIIENKYNYKIIRSCLNIEAVNADEYISKYIHIKKGAPLLFFRSVTFGELKNNEFTIEYFETYYLTNNICYTLEQFR